MTPHQLIRKQKVQSLLRCSSITTLLLAIPNLDSEASLLMIFLASSNVSIIRTPFPAASPSALITYGGERVSKNLFPSEGFLQ